MIRAAMAALALSASMAQAGPLDTEFNTFCTNAINIHQTANEADFSRWQILKMANIVGSPIPYGESTMRSMFIMLDLGVDKYAVKAYCMGEMDYQHGSVK